MSPEEQKTTSEEKAKATAEVVTEKADSTKKEETSKPMDFEEVTMKLEEFFTKKMPAFPKGLKDFLVKFIPWITLIAMIFLLPVVLVGFGLLAIFGTLAAGLGATSGGFNIFQFFSALISLGSIILTVVALPGLFKRQYKGWKYSYWNIYVSLLASVISGNIFGAAVSAFISFYVWFQIKDYYKKDGVEVLKK